MPGLSSGNAIVLATGACGSGGGGSVSVTAGTPDIVVTPSPGTGTFTVGTTSPLNVQSGASYALLTGDNTNLVEMTNASATTMTIAQAGTTGFASGYTVSVLPTANSTTITPTTSTIGGLASMSLVAGQFLSIGSDGTNYQVALSVPPSGTQNKVLATPNGSTGQPVLRALVAGDLPANGANPTATAGASAVNGSATTWMRSDGAPALQVASGATKGIVAGDSSTLTNTSGVLSCTTSTTSQIGCVKPDGTTITISSGVISSVGGSATSITPGTTTIGAATAPCFIENSTGTTMACPAVTSGNVTALGVATGSAGAPVLFNGALGTPSSGTGTNLTFGSGTLSLGNNLTFGSLTVTGDALQVSSSGNVAQAALVASIPITWDSNTTVANATIPVINPAWGTAARSPVSHTTRTAAVPPASLLM